MYTKEHFLSNWQIARNIDEEKYGKKNYVYNGVFIIIL